MTRKEPKTSLHVFLTIIQLLRRLKSRLTGCPTRRAPVRIGEGHALDSNAIRILQPIITKASLNGRKQLTGCPSRIRRCRRRGGRAANARRCNALSVQHVLQSLDLDGSISPKEHFSSVCSDSNLFLRRAHPNFHANSLNRAVRALLLVDEAVNVLSIARTRFGDSFIIAQGGEIGLSIDETFIANCEHLLLSLQSELTELLTRKVIEALILNDVDKTQRRLLSWFSVFPDSQRPLSTTWPWSIKPSLAVLWGVCWMFYNGYDAEQRHTSGARIPRDRLLQDEQVAALWPPRQANEYLAYGLEVLGEIQQSTAPQPRVEFADASRHSVGDEFEISEQPRGYGAQPQLLTQLLGTLRPSPASTPQPYYARTFLPGDTCDSSLPFDSNIATDNNVIAFPQTHPDFEAFDVPWLYAQPNLPPQPGHMITGTPSITVTCSTTQPHADFSSLYVSQQQPQGLQINSHHSSFGSPTYDMGPSPHLELSPVHIQSFKQTNTPSPHPTAEMPTPTSPLPVQSPRPSPVDEKRRYSAASSTTQLPPQSEAGSCPSEDDRGSRRGSNVKKRVVEPKKNSLGKLLCEYDGCQNFTFERKCEWTKHMDKHERPYKCRAVGCEKVKGFTYSGGLLRHEREVHKMHGPKAGWLCQVKTCKRSTGEGFTRKENFTEHMRRVHPGMDGASSDLVDLPMSKASEGNPALVNTVASSQSLSQPQNTTTLRALLPAKRLPTMHLSEDVNANCKRMRTYEPGEHDREEDLYSENKRLRRETEEKDAKIKELEERLRASESTQALTGSQR